MEGRELKLYEQRTQEVQFLRSENNFLRQDRDHYRKEWFFISQRVNQVQERNQKLVAENRRLRQQNRELLSAASSAAEKQEEKRPPDWIKPPVVRRSARSLAASWVIPRRCVPCPIILTASGGAVAQGSGRPRVLSPLQRLSAGPGGPRACG